MMDKVIERLIENNEKSIEKQIANCERILGSLRSALKEKDVDGMAIHLKASKLALLDLEDELRKIDENIDVI